MTSGEIRHRTVETNGIHMHLAEQGEGPLVVLCHGFPESWYSWRHQLAALAAAGFHAVAPDMRGYGQTDRPAEIDQYTLFHLVGDIVGLLDALGAGVGVWSKPLTERLYLGGCSSLFNQPVWDRQQVTVRRVRCFLSIRAKSNCQMIFVHVDARDLWRILF